MIYIFTFLFTIVHYLCARHIATKVHEVWNFLTPLLFGMMLGFLKTNTIDAILLSLIYGIIIWICEFLLNKKKGY